MTTMVTATTTIIPMIMTATITTVIATTTTVSWTALGFCAGVVWLVVIFAIGRLVGAKLSLGSPASCHGSRNFGAGETVKVTGKEPTSRKLAPSPQPSPPINVGPNSSASTGGEGAAIKTAQESAELAAQLDEMINAADRQIRFLKSVVRGREPLKTEIALDSNSDQNPPPNSGRMAA